MVKQLFFFNFFVTKILVIICLISIASCGNESEQDSAPVINSFSPASGFANTPITISGSKFSNVIAENIVSINGIDAEVTAATSTQITAIVPALATTGSC